MSTGSPAAGRRRSCKNRCCASARPDENAARRPMIRVSPAKRRRQRVSLITASGASPSADEKVRPSAWARAKQLEKVRRHDGAAQPLRAVGHDQINLPIQPRLPSFHERDARQRCGAIVNGDGVLTGEDRVPVARRSVEPAPDEHQAVRFRVRQRAQQHAANDAEHRRVRTDAEREQQDGADRETGPAPQHADGVAHVAAGAEQTAVRGELGHPSPCGMADNAGERRPEPEPALSSGEPPPDRRGSNPPAPRRSARREVSACHFSRSGSRPFQRLSRVRRDALSACTAGFVRR